jgi:hypothetical protein
MEPDPGVIIHPKQSAPARELCASLGFELTAVTRASSTAIFHAR